MSNFNFISNAWNLFSGFASMALSVSFLFPNGKNFLSGKGSSIFSNMGFLNNFGALGGSNFMDGLSGFNSGASIFNYTQSTDSNAGANTNSNTDYTTQFKKFLESYMKKVDDAANAQKLTKGADAVDYSSGVNSASAEKYETFYNKLASGGSENFDILGDKRGEYNNAVSSKTAADKEKLQKVYVEKFEELAKSYIAKYDSEETKTGSEVKPKDGYLNLDEYKASESDEAFNALLEKYKNELKEAGKSDAEVEKEVNEFKNECIEYTKKAFENIDTNNDGKIDYKELAAMFSFLDTDSKREVNGVFEASDFKAKSSLLGDEGTEAKIRSAWKSLYGAQKSA